MRIGELAELIGITTRAVRHYHQIGLLAEPSRQRNGYREYSLRDAVELARIRRLSELGLSLDEVRDVLAEDAGRDLAEVLNELDADLARQEETIRQRRGRLAQLLQEAQNGSGLSAQAPVSPQLADLFENMARTAAEHPEPESAMAAKERDLLALLETSRADGFGNWFTWLTQTLSADPEATARAYAVYGLLDDLADANEDDPRVAAAATAIADSMPPEAFAAIVLPESLDLDQPDGFARVLFADFAPAQAAAVRAALVLLQERQR
jgi:DNA-binding transcriptional MerR regulator